MPNDAPPMPRPLLTTADVQRILRVQPRTLNGYIRAGQLPVIRVNARRLLFDPADVRAFIAARRVRQGEDDRGR